MKDFFKSLLSRKFLLALGTTLVLISSGQYDQAVIVVLGYLGVNVVNKMVPDKTTPEQPSIPEQVQ